MNVTLCGPEITRGSRRTSIVLITILIILIILLILFFRVMRLIGMDVRMISKLEREK